ncbi:hypothetical protein THAOC_09286, partial [Thalassiosira oceanica]
MGGGACSVGGGGTGGRARDFCSAADGAAGLRLFRCRRRGGRGPGWGSRRGRCETGEWLDWVGGGTATAGVVRRASCSAPT